MAFSSMGLRSTSEEIFKRHFVKIVDERDSDLEFLASLGTDARYGLWATGFSFFPDMTARPGLVFVTDSCFAWVFRGIPIQARFERTQGQFR
jgi:hypothetical protein